MNMKSFFKLKGVQRLLLSLIWFFLRLCAQGANDAGTLHDHHLGGNGRVKRLQKQCPVKQL